MKIFLTQFQKDFFAYFNSFIAYVIIAVYTLLSFFSALYLGNYFLREIDVMNSFFVMQPSVLLLIIPAITMRSWADENKNGTLELLLTQPISYSKLILAKFFASFCFFLLLVSFSIPFLIITSFLTLLDWGIVISAYCGLILCGGLFTAVGCLVSSLCRNSITSFICTIFSLLLIMQFKLAPINSTFLVIPLEVLNFFNNYNAFLSGILFVNNVIYFICGIILLLWLNIVTMSSRQILNRKRLFGFIGLLILIFSFLILTCNLFFNSPFDISHNQFYTLSKNNQNYLNTIDKRIDITLYEAKTKREDETSSYAIHAEFVERFLKQIQRLSFGAVRHSIIRVEAFSELERQLIDEGIPYEEDNTHNKSYLTLSLSDNDGNFSQINTLSSLRFNLFEADIMRAIKTFGKSKNNIAVIASPNELAAMQGFRNLLTEFYTVAFLDEHIEYLSSEYDAVIVINPTDLQHEMLVALDQYLLNGGNIVFFSDPNPALKTDDDYLADFLGTYGIRPIFNRIISQNDSELGIAELPENYFGDGVRTILVHSVGEVENHNSSTFTTSPLLSFNGKTIAAISTGKYRSNYPRYIEKYSDFLPFSLKTGKILFFNDSDLIKDYMYVSRESKGTEFYQTISFFDNHLFQLRLMAEVTNSSTEKDLPYHHYLLNSMSIGQSILTNLKQTFQKALDDLQQEISSIKNKLSAQTSLTSKDVKQRARLLQRLNQAEDELNITNRTVLNNYKSIILFLTLLLGLVIPCIILGGTLLFVHLLRKCRNFKIRRLISHAQTN